MGEIPDFKEVTIQDLRSILEFTSGDKEGKYCFNFMNCMGEATHLVTGGCVHEHIATYKVCQEDLERLRVALFYCTLCDKAGCKGCNVNITSSEPLPVES
jgi:hypothetical protein